MSSVDTIRISHHWWQNMCLRQQQLSDTLQSDGQLWRCKRAQSCAWVYVLTETPLLHCADEPWPAVSEGISPLNDTKLQGSTSAERIHCCLHCFNWIEFGWTAGTRLYILLKLRKINITTSKNWYDREKIPFNFNQLSTVTFVKFKH